VGLLVGFAGVGLVLAPKLASHGVGSLTPLPVAAALVSVFAVTTVPSCKSGSPRRTYARRRAFKVSARRSSPLLRRCS
jgi:hypothetical protein